MVGTNDDEVGFVAPGNHQRGSASRHGNSIYPTGINGLNPDEDTYITGKSPTAESYLKLGGLQNGEMVLQHKFGSRIKINADGSMEVFSNQGALNITAGDDITIKSSGNGTLKFDGDVNLHSTGNMSITADQGLNISAGTSMSESVRNGSKTEIYKAKSQQVVEDSNYQVGGTLAHVSYSQYSNLTKGTANFVANGDYIVKAKRELSLSSTVKASLVSRMINQAARHFNIASNKGTWGGDYVYFKGHNLRLWGTLYSQNIDVSKTIRAETYWAKNHIRTPVVIGHLKGVAEFAKKAGFGKVPKVNLPELEKLGTTDLRSFDMVSGGNWTGGPAHWASQPQVHIDAALHTMYPSPTIYGGPRSDAVSIPVGGSSFRDIPIDFQKILTAVPLLRISADKMKSIYDKYA